MSEEPSHTLETVVTIVAVAAALVLVAVFVDRMIQEGSILGPSIDTRENDGNTYNETGTDT